MFKDLVSNIAQGTDLRPTLHALDAEWRALSSARRKPFGSLDQFVHARWMAPESGAFPWQCRAGALDQLAHPFTAHVIYKSGDDPLLRAWELVGYSAAIRDQLTVNLQSVASIPDDQRPTDLKVLHCEILTAFRIEDMALHRQIEHVQEFLERAGCRVLHVRGVDDADAARRRQPFASAVVENYRIRLEKIIAQFFAITPVVLAHPSSDPSVALRETGADRIFTFDPNRTPPFELEPVLKAECELYLDAGVVECDVGDLRRTLSAVTDVLEERFCLPSRALEQASA